MGICESSDLAQNTLLFKKELQPYHAPKILVKIINKAFSLNQIL